MSTSPCDCHDPSSHRGHRVVLTGGPGAGKTAVLEVVRKYLCQHVMVLPEAAGIIYGGGFPRLSTVPARRAAQVAIFHVQDQLERIALSAEPLPAMVLCDRGIIDGLAYWPEDAESFYAAVGTTREAAFARYAAVIHLRTPTTEGGYNHRNPLRVETAAEATALDEKLFHVWEGHPRRYVVECTKDFMEKLTETLNALRAELPVCCLTPAAPRLV